MKFRDYIFENTVKTFRKYLLDENYMRFLKKNPNLTQDQREKINKFYTGKGSQHAVKEFEKEIGWQSKRVREMTWEDFAKIMKSSKAGQRELLQSTEIPGTKGKDYWPIRLKNKKYIANIPLNFKTAKFMNSCDYGTINVNYCIGDAKYGIKYWKMHVVQEKKIPIYITDGKGKWVVMIKPDNRKYEVWDKLNNKNLAITNKEPIPDFSIQKELLPMGMKKLYNELRKYIEAGPHWIKNAEVREADYVIGYNNNINNIIWKDGLWLYGIWKGGLWKKGTWRKGIWEDGTWEKGTWEDGTWKKGTWEDGTWKGGLWEGSDRWPESVWEKGIWENGTWYKGVWKGGTWENGKWFDGKWEGGTWEGGYDKDGNYHPEGDSPDKWGDVHWIQKANIKNADYEIEDNNYFIWKEGTWKSGTWEGDEWWSGTWKKGTWKRGNFLGGTWEKGTWKDGTWEAGTWEDGTWEKGNWYADDGIWEKGTWKDGTWDAHYGVWLDGTWEKGIWKNGIWKGGTWLGGTWEGGTWEGGYDKDGNYHPEGDSPDKWENEV